MNKFKVWDLVTFKPFEEIAKLGEIDHLHNVKFTDGSNFVCHHTMSKLSGKGFMIEKCMAINPKGTYIYKLGGPSVVENWVHEGCLTTYDVRKEWTKSANRIKELIYAYMPPPTYSMPSPMKVFFNDPVTVVIWKDGTKTTVRRMKGQRNCSETALAMAYMKKIFGSHSQYKKHVNSLKEIFDSKKKKGR